MKRILLSIVLISFILSPAKSAVPVFDFTQFESRVQQNNDTLYIVNFWATWCKPCVAELPIFEALQQTYSQKPVKIILVSQDAKARTTQVSDFLKNNNYTSECFILSAGNPNVWINKIDSNWSGLIPMTVLYKSGKKVYIHEGDYAAQEELEKIIHSKL